MDVAVIGGGIGGLSLALQLHRVGIECRVYERAARLLRAVRSQRRLRRPALLDPPRRAPPGAARGGGGPRRSGRDVPPLHARRQGGCPRPRGVRGRPARPCVDAVACDGFHSVVRRQFHPHEGPPHFGGINLWRGVTRSEPFLTGASIARIGEFRRGTSMIYRHEGTQLATRLVGRDVRRPRVSDGR